MVSAAFGWQCRERARGGMDRRPFLREGAGMSACPKVTGRSGRLPGSAGFCRRRPADSVAATARALRFCAVGLLCALAACADPQPGPALDGSGGPDEGGDTETTAGGEATPSTEIGRAHV